MNEHEQMLTDILQCGRTDMYTRPVRLTDDQSARLKHMIDRRDSGEPLQYILGYTSFMGLNLRCDRRALIPRPETEGLVEKVVDYLRGDSTPPFPKIVDLGTGSGNIAVAIRSFIPGARVTAVDISSEALDLARSNAKDHHFDDTIELTRADMAVYLRECRQRSQIFDVIISNPPYIPDMKMAGLPRDVRQEPDIALRGGSDGLDFYRVILQECCGILSERGIVALECWDHQAEAILAIGTQTCPRLKGRSFHDYTGNDRYIIFHR